MRDRLRRVWGFVSNPLTVSQVASSASGALSLLILAAKLPPDQFGIISLATLIAATAIGILRATLTMPTLMVLRQQSGVWVGGRLAAVFITLIAVLSGATTLMTSRSDVSLGPILLLIFTLPLVQDFLRFRAISVNRRPPIMAGDLARLAATAAMAAIPIPSAVQGFALIGLGYGLSALIIGSSLYLGRETFSRPRPVRLSEIRNTAATQTTEFVIGMLGSTVPLLILGALQPVGAAAAIRLAQSLFGPLNLIFAASESGYVADGATKKALGSERRLIALGVKISNRLGLVSIMIVGVILGLSWSPAVYFRAVGEADLKLAIVLVGAIAVTSGWSGFHNVILRLLGRSGSVAIQRAAFVALTSSGYILAWLWTRDPSTTLVAGFVVNAIGYPLVFILPSYRIYRAAGWRLKDLS
jgi:hypothetical protein